MFLLANLVCFTVLRMKCPTAVAEADDSLVAMDDTLFVAVDGRRGSPSCPSAVTLLGICPLLMSKVAVDAFIDAEEEVRARVSSPNSSISSQLVVEHEYRLPRYFPKKEEVGKVKVSSSFSKEAEEEVREKVSSPSTFLISSLFVVRHEYRLSSLSS